MKLNKYISLIRHNCASIPFYPDGLIIFAASGSTLCSVWDLYWLIAQFRMVKVVWIVLPFAKSTTETAEIVDQKRIVSMILVVIMTVSIAIDFLLVWMTISNYRWNIFWIRQVIKLGMYRSSLEFTIRLMNLFFYFSFQRYISVEFVNCFIHLSVVLLAYQLWQSIYRKNVTLYWLSTRRLSDEEFLTVQTVLVKQ